MKRKILSLSLFLMLFSCTFQLQAQEYVQQTDLPTIYIETEGGRPIVSKEDYVDAVLHYVDSNGVKTYDALGVRGRGNSTWNLDKKPYRIKFAEKLIIHAMVNVYHVGGPLKISACILMDKRDRKSVV